MYRGTHQLRRKGRWKLPVALLLVVALGAGAAWYFWPRPENTLPQRQEPVDEQEQTPEDTLQPKPDEPTIPEETKPEQIEGQEEQEDPAVLAAREALLEQAETMARGYFYDEALALLDENAALDNEHTEALRQEILAQQASLVPYEGEQFYHIFFHSLVVDPSRAFDGDGDSVGYDLYMTTVEEFQAMLPKLEEAGYILYNIEDLVTFENGTAERPTILLPPGKKPLVISVDDVNYYKYMEGDGFATRLDVDADGNVVTIVDGEATYDGDVMPILDQYVREHPEFSWRGAKGIVALTGYEGAFGYRITDLEDYDEETQKWMLERTQAVAQALRASGWEIACHSYTHNQYWNNQTITMDQEAYDIGRWKRDVVPYVGETNIFISPFGVSFSDDDARLQYLQEQGFQIYCHVDSTMPTRWSDKMFFQGRLNLDGLTMKSYPERVSRFFFEPSAVLDAARPG